MKPHVENLYLNMFPVSDDLQNSAFWDRQRPLVILSQAHHKKDTTQPALYKHICLETRSRYEDREAFLMKKLALHFTPIQSLTLANFQKGQLQFFLN